MTARSANPASATYPISPWRLWLITGALTALGVLLLVCAEHSTADPDARRAFMLTAVFIFGCDGVLYLVLRFTRLELSARGIKLYQIGYTLETDWDNFASLHDVAGAEGLVLHRPMSCRGASALRAFRNTGRGAGVRFYSVEQVRLLEERRFIPIAAFAYWLKHGRLRHDLASRGSSLGM